jgi:hypothetical protein
VALDCCNIWGLRNSVLCSDVIPPLCKEYVLNIKHSKCIELQCLRVHSMTVHKVMGILMILIGLMFCGKIPFPARSVVEAEDQTVFSALCYECI